MYRNAFLCPLSERALGRAERHLAWWLQGGEMLLCGRRLLKDREILSVLVTLVVWWVGS